jgi:hypothetical protein
MASCGELPRADSTARCRRSAREILKALYVASARRLSRSYGASGAKPSRIPPPPGDTSHVFLGLLVFLDDLLLERLDAVRLARHSRVFALCFDRLNSPTTIEILVPAISDADEIRPEGWSNTILNAKNQ